MTECRLPQAGCICSNKDKNFKANHNSACISKNLYGVVSVVTKIRILKQITTRTVVSDSGDLLYL